MRSYGTQMASLNHGISSCQPTLTFNNFEAVNLSSLPTILAHSMNEIAVHQSDKCSN